MNMASAFAKFPFDPRRHVTARELRAIGFYVSEMLDDGAYVTRDAVGLSPEEELHDGSASLGLMVLEPFTTVSPLELCEV